MNFKTGRKKRIYVHLLAKLADAEAASQEKSSKSSETLQERTNDFKFQFKGGVSRLTDTVKERIKLR